MVKHRRFRDPIYDLYTFGLSSDDKRKRVDAKALMLIETKEFQRLRRIKQLGFADYVYPGASHTRFAHSLGVYAVAQTIIQELKDNNALESEDLLDNEDIEDTLLAALLHDIGHGPFSHAFENPFIPLTQV